MNEEDTGKSFLLLAVFNVLLLAAVFAIGWKQHRNGASAGWDPCRTSSGAPLAGCTEPASESMGPIVSIDDVMVQLQPYKDDRYLRLSLDLEVDGERSQTVVVRRTPEIRDAILRTFAERKSDEVQGSEALADLKRSLMQELASIVPGKRIRAIYVTDFAVM